MIYKDSVLSSQLFCKSGTLLNLKFINNSKSQLLGHTGQMQVPTQTGPQRLWASLPWLLLAHADTHIAQTSLGQRRAPARPSQSIPRALPVDLTPVGLPGDPKRSQSLGQTQARTCPLGLHPSGTLGTPRRLRLNSPNPNHRPPETSSASRALGSKGPLSRPPPSPPSGPGPSLELALQPLLRPSPAALLCRGTS